MKLNIVNRANLKALFKNHSSSILAVLMLLIDLRLGTSLIIRIINVLNAVFEVRKSLKKI